MQTAAELWLELIERERKWFELLCQCAAKRYRVIAIERQDEPQKPSVVELMLTDRNRQLRN